MSKPILTPDELNALMGGQFDSASTTQTLESYFEPMLSLLESKFTRLFGLNVSVSNFYVQKIDSLEDVVGAEHDCYATPIQLPFGETLVLSSVANGDILANFLGVEIEKAVTLFVEEYALILADFFSDKLERLISASTYDSTLMSKEQVLSLPVGFPSYLVSFDLSFKDNDLEIRLLVPNDTCRHILKDANQDTVKITGASKSQMKAFGFVQPFQFMEIKQEVVATKTGESVDSSGLISDVTVELRAELGSATMTLGQLMKLKEGDTVTLDKIAGDLADVYLNGQNIARAEVTVLDDNFGLRIVDIVPPEQRLDS
ncbi:MAG: flagellar motor switch protein FliN [Firmicutes bacterium]|nr:flagellar motor switch protein FliN [Bacillota bacterium]